MTDLPRLTPYEVLQVLDQMKLEAEMAADLVAWRHTGVCGGLTGGIWEPGSVCSGCRFEENYQTHIDQYLLVPTAEPPSNTIEPDRATRPTTGGTS